MGWIDRIGLCVREQTTSFSGVHKNEWKMTGELRVASAGGR
jgi:hypothetical protein